MAGEQPDALKRLVIFIIALAILGIILALGAIYLLPAIESAIPLNHAKAPCPEAYPHASWCVPR